MHAYQLGTVALRQGGSAELKITEIPGDEPARCGGKRKLQIFRWGMAYYFQFVRDWLLWSMRGIRESPEMNEKPPFPLTSHGPFRRRGLLGEALWRHCCSARGAGPVLHTLGAGIAAPFSGRTRRFRIPPRSGISSTTRSRAGKWRSGCRTQPKAGGHLLVRDASLTLPERIDVLREALETFRPAPPVVLGPVRGRVDFGGGELAALPPVFPVSADGGFCLHLCCGLESLAGPALLEFPAVLCAAPGAAFWASVP